MSNETVTSPQFEECLNQIQRSKSDNEMFAALFMVTRVVKAEDCDADTRMRILDAIGFKFIKRLLKTASVPEDCPKNVFKSMALNLLTSLCTDDDEDMMTDPELLDLIPLVIELLSIDVGDGEDPEMDKAIIDDAMRILTMVGKFHLGRVRLIENGYPGKLALIYVNDGYGAGTALDVLLSCLYWADEIPVMWLCNKQGCFELLKKMSDEFRQECEATKFQLCDKLSRIVDSLHGVKESIEMEPWASDIHRGLSDVLSSRIGQDQRNPALKLGAAMLNCFGIEWAVKTGDEKFLMLVVNLASIEVRMILESGADSDELLSQSPVLSSCYSVLETLITYMSSETDMPFDSEKILQLQSAITQAFNAVLYFLDWNCENEEIPDSLIFASIRALGAWLAEETSSLRDEVYQILPFLIKVSQKTLLLLEKPADALSSPPVDVLRFLLPGLCHLSADDTPRNILIENNAHELLGRYFTFQWKLFVSKKSEDSRTALTLLCGIFLNFAVLESELLGSHAVFKEVASMLISNAPILAGDQSSITLLANMVVLCLMCLRHQKTRKTPDDTVKKFLTTTCTFLQDSHMVQGDRLRLSKAYRAVWTEVSELWFLAAQELSCVIEKYPSLSSILVDNGWVENVLSQLQQTAGRGASEEMLPSYDRLLATVATPDEKAKSLMKQRKGLSIARSSKMVNLKKVLES